MVQTITYAEALKNTNSDERILLLGNGFSISVDKKFNYATLYEEASSKFSRALSSIFNELGTTDFEKVLAHLNILFKLIKHYDKLDGAEVENDILELKKVFLNTFNDIHLSSISGEQENKIRSLLTNYRKIFTTNYDLILYWAILSRNNQLKSSGQKEHFKDGFGKRGHRENKLYWRNPADQNVYYLHGALHLFENSSDKEINKIETGKEDNGCEALKNLIKNKIQNRHDPLIVFEGHYTEKLKHIEQNAYLKHAYDILKGIEGPLFILGSSLNQYSDGHILSALRDNKKIHHLYIGFHEDEQGMRRAIRQSSIDEHKGISIFDVKEAFPWGTDGALSHKKPQ